LATADSGIFPGIFAKTIYDPNCVNAGDVEDGEISRFGWLRAGVADAVTELERRA